MHFNRDIIQASMKYFNATLCIKIFGTIGEYLSQLLNVENKKIFYKL